MRNIKKAVSVVTVLAILLSVLSVSVQANELLTVNYWNADSSKIVLDFSREVDADSLKAWMTLSKDGTELSGNDFTVVKKVKSTTATNSLAVDNNFTYYIMPSDGMSFGSTYSLIVPLGLASTDGNAVLQESFEKSFMVEKIWMENFESYTEQNPSPWIPWLNGSTKQISYVKDASGDTELLLSMTGGYDGIVPKPSLTTGTFADTGMSVASYFASTDVAEKLTDYTLEAKVKIASEDDSALAFNHSVVMSMQCYTNTTQLREFVNRLTYTPLISAGFGIINNTARLNVVANNPVNGTITAQYNGEKAVMILGDNLQWGAALAENTTIFTNNVANNVSLSVKGENIKFAAGDSVFASYNFDNTTLGLTNYRLPSIIFNSTNGKTHNYYIDDIVATRVNEIKISDVTVEYFNADSSRFIVDLSEAPKAEILKNVITVSKDGVQLSDGEFEVVKKAKSTTATNTLIKDENTSYYIIPSGGVDFDSVYLVSISGEIMDGSNGYRFGENFSKQFKVEKIWQETFENYSESNPNPWEAWKSGSTRTTQLVKNNSGDTELVFEMTKSSADGVHPNPTLTTGTFADTGKSVNSYFSGSSTAEKLKDYTLEAKIRIESETDSTLKDSRGSHGVYLVIQKYVNSTNKQFYYNRLNADMPIVVGGFNGSPAQSNFGAIAIAQNAKGQSNNTTTLEIAECKPAATNTPNKSPYTAGEETLVTLSVKEGNIKASAGDSEFISYYFDTATIDVSTSVMPAIVIPVNYYHSYTYYIDDVCATKMKEVVTGSYTMSPADGETEASISDTVTLTFGDVIDVTTATKDNIAVYENGKAVDNYTVSVNSANPNELIVKFDKVFDYRAEYKIVPGDIKMSGDATNYAFYPSSFTADVPHIELSGFAVSGNADMDNLTPGTYTATASFANNKGAATENVIMSICLFDSNKKLLDIEIKKLSVPKGGDETLTATWEITEAGAYTSNCFVWGNIDTMGTIFNENIK